MMQRSGIRKRYNIEGSRANDIAVALFCPPCTLVQNHREVQSREKDGRLHKDRLRALEYSINEQPQPHSDMLYAPASSRTSGILAPPSTHRGSLVGIKNVKSYNPSGSALNALPGKQQRTPSGRYVGRSPEERAIIERRQPWRAKSPNPTKQPDGSLVNKRTRPSTQCALDRVKAIDKASGSSRSRGRSHDSSYEGDRSSSQHSISESFKVDLNGNSGGTAYQHILIERQNIEPNNSRLTSCPALDWLPDEAVFIYYDPNEKPQRRFISGCSRPRYFSAGTPVSTSNRPKRAITELKPGFVDNCVQDSHSSISNTLGQGHSTGCTDERTSKGKGVVLSAHANLKETSAGNTITNEEPPTELTEESSRGLVLSFQNLDTILGENLPVDYLVEEAAQDPIGRNKSINEHSYSSCTIPVCSTSESDRMNVIQNAHGNFSSSHSKLAISQTSDVLQHRLTKYTAGTSATFITPSPAHFRVIGDGVYMKVPYSDHISQHLLDDCEGDGNDSGQAGDAQESSHAPASTTGAEQHWLYQCVVDSAEVPQNPGVTRNIEQHGLKECVLEVAGSREASAVEQHDLERCVVEVTDPPETAGNFNSVDQHELGHCIVEVTDNFRRVKQVEQHFISDCPTESNKTLTSPETVVQTKTNALDGCNTETNQISSSKKNNAKARPLCDCVDDDIGIRFTSQWAPSQQTPKAQAQHSLDNCAGDHNDDDVSIASTPRDDLVLSPQLLLTIMSPRPFNPEEQQNEQPDPEMFAQTRRASFALSLVPTEEAEEKKSWDEQVADELEERERELAESGGATADETIDAESPSGATQEDQGNTENPGATSSKPQKKKLTDGKADREALLRILKDPGERGGEFQSDTDIGARAAVDGAGDLSAEDINMRKRRHGSNENKQGKRRLGRVRKRRVIGEKGGRKLYA